MRSFTEVFDKHTDDNNSRSAKQQKEATWEISGAVVYRLSRLPHTQKVSSSILDSIRKSIIIKLNNKECTKILLVRNYISTNSRKIA